TRLSKIAREFNVGISTIVEFLNKKGYKIDSNPNTKLDPDLYDILVEEYSNDLNVKIESKKLALENFRERRESISISDMEEPADEESEELLITDTTAVSKYEEEEPDVPETEEAVAEAEEEGEPGEKEPGEEKAAEKKAGPKVLGKIDLELMNQRTRPKKKTQKEIKEEEEEKIKAGKEKPTEKEPSKPVKEKEAEKKAEPADVPEEAEKFDLPEKEELIPTLVEKLTGPTVVGKIVLPEKKEYKKKPVATSADPSPSDKKKKRKRIRKDTEQVEVENGETSEKTSKKDKYSRKKRRVSRPEVNEEDVQRQIKDTLAKLTTKGKSKTSKYRREKREAVHQKMQENIEKLEHDRNILKVTEFVSVNELATMMNVPANEVIATCMSLGLLVSINQRLDAETMALVADEFGYKVEFISVEVQEAIREEEDNPEDLTSRPPIVTVMGHVDHGKTKLLDYIRSTNVVAGEEGGITQHIGAYGVELDDGRKITFLDTPGHEAFTAMRARGAQITDVAIIVVAADDGVKPQTVEAINHAAAAGVPIVFAINKIDKPSANPEKVKEELANMNYMVEDWGGKYQSQEISAKNGINIDDLLEKVLLEAELLDLKANPAKRASGTVIESTLDKGRGNIATILVESGTLHIGDVLLAGHYFGHVKAMFNERGKKVPEAGPSTPILILGLNGAPQAGDGFNVMDSDKEAKDIAVKRSQLQREQELRTTKHITLDEIGRRIAIGNFQELNIIVKGDVDGSIEALSDSLIKLGTDEIQVNIKHKAVGQISESDILLAAASNAIVIGFQVRPSLSARKLAEKEQIDIRLYSIIYDAIEEVKAAMEGMLSPDIKEEIIGTLEVQEVFKITKVGTIAGCKVREGKIKSSSKVRLIREGIVIYSGLLGSLKRFKDDAKEVVNGLECGLNIENFNDIKVGDVIEAYEETEVKKTLG
ncbi:MAG TPA: translation initiation factor IF-2, partial [Desulfobacteraceae bacterium]|nr:translation initiation factor IF-2 [Desulfobacteraceae bacterium]